MSRSLNDLRVLIVPGSARTGSLNVQLAHAVAASVKAKGAQATVTDLRALALPIYDGDLHAASGIPAGAKTLIEQFAAHDAVVVVSPEYNAFPPPLLMNAIDWVSLAPEHKPAMNGKPTALMSASPGALGGIRSLLSLRQFLSLNPGLLVIGPQFGLAAANKAFAADGTLADEKQRAMLEGVVDTLLKTAGAVAS